MSLSDRGPKRSTLDFLLGTGFYPSFEEHYLDPGQSLDRGIISAIKNGRLEQDEHELSELLASSPDEASAMANLMPWLSQTGIPDGESYRGFLIAVLSRVRQALADPTSIPDPGATGDGLQPDRVSRFHDLETANEVSTLALRAHEDELRRWVDDPGGWWRQHYYLPDVGKPTGVVMRRGVEATQEVNGVVVVMKRDPATGQAFVDSTYPERAFPTEPRTEVPDLRHLFGGYLGQDCFEEGGPLTCQHNFHATTRDPARSRVREQLDALLTKNDEDLRAAVEALGCYVLPQALRAYVMRIRWRLDAFDWTADAPGS